MLNDSVASALSLMLNAEKIGKADCVVWPASKVLKKVLLIMKDHTYIGDFIETDEGKGTFIKINLIGRINKCAAIKPRYAVKKGNFEKYEIRYLPAKGMGIIIVSTPQGIMTIDEARKKAIGGRMIAYVY